MALLEWGSIFVDSRDTRIANLKYNATRASIGQMSLIKRVVTVNDSEGEMEK